MRTLFAGIPLDKMSVSMTMNGAVLPILALYIVAAEEQGVRPTSCPGPSRTTSSRSSWSATPTSIRRALDADHLGHLRLHLAEDAEVQLDLDQRLPHAGGRGDADLELAYTLADGVEYARAGVAAGHEHRPFAPRLSFFWAIGMNYFMEVAKMRAARLLWARLMKREFDPKDDRSRCPCAPTARPRAGR
jgi:methylmalonyl-CoA mutase